jgi:glycine cleavage system aminomethyltransferase T
MVDFAGWQMPIQYPQGIIAEHLAVRRQLDCLMFPIWADFA